MGSITLNIPDIANIDDREATMLMATLLYQKGKLSLGQAAIMAGLSRVAFADILGIYNVSIFNYPASEITDDVKNA